MFLDPVVRIAASRRLRRLAAVAVAAAVVVASLPAESATRKKQATGTPAASPAASPSARSVGSAAFSLPSSIALVDDVTNGAAIVRQGSVASLAGSTVSVGGTRTVTIEALANEALAESRTGIR